MLIKSGGVAKILAGSKGQITTVYVEKDELVYKGQILARIDQTEMVDTLLLKQKKVEELKRQLALRENLGGIRTDKESRSRELKLRSLERQIEVDQDWVRTLSGQIKRQESLVKEAIAHPEENSMKSGWNLNVPRTA